MTRQIVDYSTAAKCHLVSVCAVTENYERIRTYSRSKSSKVINLGAKLKANMQLPITHY